MELELLNIIFCDSVVPLPDKKMVCYGIFNELTIPELPFAYPHFSIMCAWSNGKGFHVQQIKLLNPSRSLIISQSPEQYFTLEEETETAYVITDVNRIVFTEAGTYYAQVFINNNLMGEASLHFRVSARN
mgnify:CR=1 FL=1